MSLNPLAPLASLAFRGLAFVRTGKTRVVYFALMALGLGLAFAKLFLLGRTLSKADYGLYALVTLLLTYATTFGNLGLVEGFALRGPVLIGQQRRHEANTLRNDVLGASLVTSTGFGGIALAAAFVYRLASGVDHLPIVGVAIFQTIAVVVFNIVLRDLRSRLYTNLFAAVIVGRGVLDGLNALVIAPRFGVTGTLVGESTNLILLAGLLLITVVERPGVSIADRSQITSAMRDGLLIAFAGVLSRTAVTAEQLAMGFAFPKEQFAIYCAHFLVATGAMAISNIVVQMLQPMVLHRFGETGRYSDVLALAHRATLVLLALGALGAPVVIGVFPCVARYAFPGYTISRTLLGVIFVGAVLEMANVYPHAVMASKRLHTILVIQGIACAATMTAAFACVALTRKFLPFGTVYAVGRALTFGLFLREATQAKAAPTPTLRRPAQTP